MKKIALITSIFLFATTYVFAQNQVRTKFKTTLKDAETKKNVIKVDKNTMLDVVKDLEHGYYTVQYDNQEYLIFQDNIELIESPKVPVNLTIDEKTNKITYTGIVELPSEIDKDQLYSRGVAWFATTYNSAQNVLQMQDKENGKLIGRALFDVYHKGIGMTFESGHINYTISLFFKDNRYKYEITDFMHTSNIESGMIKTSCDEMRFSTKKLYTKVYNYYFEQLDNNMKSLIIDLKQFMNKQSESDDDW